MTGNFDVAKFNVFPWGSIWLNFFPNWKKFQGNFRKIKFTKIVENKVYGSTWTEQVLQLTQR